MKKWKLSQDVDKYLALSFSKHEDLGENLDFTYGFESLKDKWKAFEVSVIKNRRLKMGDFPYLGPSSYVFSEKAIEILKDFLFNDNIEILPLNCSEGKFWTINVLNVIDCLDINKKSGGFFGFDKYVLKKELIKEEDIFIIPNEGGGVIFVSDRFKEKVINSELEGFEFLDVCECE